MMKMMKMPLITVMLLLFFVPTFATKCAYGYVLNTKIDKCVPCDPGYYHNKHIDQCVPCGFGEYSYRRGSTSCVKCHARYSDTHYLVASTSCNNSEIVKFISNSAKSVVEYAKSFM